jgi:hypothetical protein
MDIKTISTIAITSSLGYLSFEFSRILFSLCISEKKTKTEIVAFSALTASTFIGAIIGTRQSLK